MDNPEAPLGGQSRMDNPGTWGHRWVHCIITITNNKKHNTEVDLNT
jgi:hypothetical protein